MVARGLGPKPRVADRGDVPYVRTAVALQAAYEPPITLQKGDVALRAEPVGLPWERFAVPVVPVAVPVAHHGRRTPVADPRDGIVGHVEAVCVAPQNDVGIDSLHGGCHAVAQGLWALAVGHQRKVRNDFIAAQMPFGDQPVERQIPVNGGPRYGLVENQD